MWGRFWDSFGAADTHDNESQLSDPISSQLLSTHSQHSSNHHTSNLNRAISPEPSASFSQLHGFSEITPNESASMVANNDDGRSMMSEDIHALSRGEDVFSFKFTTLGGKTHRVASSSHSYITLLESVYQKVIGEHMAHSTVDDSDLPVESWLSISYLDDENDQVLITSDADVADAVKLARKMGQDRVKLFVHDATQKEETVVTASVVGESVIEEKPVPVPVLAPAPPVVASPPPTPVVETPEPSHHKKSKRRSMRREYSSDSEDEEHDRRSRKQDNNGATVAGIPQELVLPAAIAFLGVVIVGVFALSRVGSSHR